MQPLQWLGPSQTSQLNQLVTDPKLTGQFIVSIFSQLARLYCIHYELIGQPYIEYESHCRLIGWLYIVSIFDWLAGLVLYLMLLRFLADFL